MDNYKVGDIIKCQVTGIENYGIFVNVDSQYSGLIHISEVSNGFVKDINDFVKEGEEIYCQILEVDKENNHLKLSIKNINYKSSVSDKQIQESRLGFLPLKNALPKWIEEALKTYNK
jgi:predicted RNA-binding protein with RPS1 domain